MSLLAKYAFTNARVRAMLSSLLTVSQLDSLANAKDIDEFLLTLKATPYEAIFEKLTVPYDPKMIELELMLEGEKEPLHVKVNRYELREEGSRYYLVAEDIVTSRAWINTVAVQYLHGQKFEIPAEYAKLLKVVV